HQALHAGSGSPRPITAATNCSTTWLSSGCRDMISMDRTFVLRPSRPDSPGWWHYTCGSGPLRPATLTDTTMIHDQRRRMPNTVDLHRLELVLHEKGHRSPSVALLDQNGNVLGPTVTT